MTKKRIQSKISADYKKLIEEIQENSSIQIIMKVKMMKQYWNC